MFLTEAEARKTWCPHAVASHNDPRRGFREGETRDENCFVCIASDCSQWRVAFNSLGLPSDKGYCGLAGRPEGTPS